MPTDSYHVTDAILDREWPEDSKVDVVDGDEAEPSVAIMVTYDPMGMGPSCNTILRKHVRQRLTGPEDVYVPSVFYTDDTATPEVYIDYAEGAPEEDHDLSRTLDIMQAGMTRCMHEQFTRHTVFQRLDAYHPEVADDLYFPMRVQDLLNHPLPDNAPPPDFLNPGLGPDDGEDEE